MKFILRENLRTGMRLARPIYSKDGTLLYNVGSRLTEQGISSVNNFGIIGLYILEDAEPEPVLSDEEIEMERFLIAGTTKLYSDWEKIREGRIPVYLSSLVADIVSRYGELDHKISFFQTIRSSEDKQYKHCLSTAILCALICKQMGKRRSETNTCVMAALLHEIGWKDISKELREKNDVELTEDEKKELSVEEYKSLQYLETKANNLPAIRQLMGQHFRMRRMERFGRLDPETRNYPEVTRILTVACAFDRMTSMDIGKEPVTELSAVRIMRENTDLFHTAVVNALVESVNVLVSGCSVRLTNGLSGCVIKENRFYMAKPVVLLFDNNEMLDLSDVKKHGNLAVEDVVKTLDNRWVIDRKFIDAYMASLKKKPR